MPNMIMTGAIETELTHLIARIHILYYPSHKGSSGETREWPISSKDTKERRRGMGRGSEAQDATCKSFFIFEGANANPLRRIGVRTWFDLMIA